MRNSMPVLIAVLVTLSGTLAPAPLCAAATDALSFLDVEAPAAPVPEADTSAQTPATPTGPSAALNGLDVATAGTRLDAWIAERYPNSPMNGYGATIAACAAKYNIPVELAMSMLCMESGFGSSRMARRTNNPGNLRDGSGQYGTITGTTKGGFAFYENLETGIEAYFRLLDDPARPYRARLDSGDIKGLIRIYAPPSDNNDQGAYMRAINSVSRRIRGALAPDEAA